MARFWCTLLCLLAWTAHLPLAAGQLPEPLDPDVLAELAEENAGFLPGLRFRVDGRKGTSQVDRLAFEADAASSVEWSGLLESQVDGDYRFAALVVGQLTVRVNGQELLTATVDEPQWIVSQPVDLKYDRHRIQVTLASISSAESKLTLFWSGPGFRFEPIPANHLWHAESLEEGSLDGASQDRDSQDTSETIHAGRELVRVLRCAACHAWGPSEEAGGTGSRKTRRPALRSPDLSQVKGNLQPAWLTTYLTTKLPNGESSQHKSSQRDSSEADQSEREPVSVQDSWSTFHAQLQPNEAAAVTAYLSSLSNPVTLPSPQPDTQLNVAKAKSSDPAAGREIFYSTGCLACHQVEGVGNNQPFGGGDLSRLDGKRPRGFFPRWLQDPSSINSQHRMPVFDLTDEERANVAAFLESLDDSIANATSFDTRHPDALDTVASDSQTLNAETGDSEINPARRELIFQGKALVEQRSCTACHAIGDQPQPNPLTPLNAASAWEVSCVTASQSATNHSRQQPNYGLERRQRAAIEQHFKQAPSSEVNTLSHTELLLAENNCFACHAREFHAGLLPTVQSVVAKLPGQHEHPAALLPPSLNSVGDKLHARVLDKSISRQGDTARRWLSVQMPRFPLEATQVSEIANYFISADRVPDTAYADSPILESHELKQAERLFGSDGFGCTSCHAVGKVQPAAKTPLHQLGPKLSMLGQRVRKTWFDRWVRNPARIVPNMEMPSVQVPIRNLMQGHLDRQLGGVWELLNTRKFSPPDTAPTRIVSRSGQAGSSEGPVVLTDVFRVFDKQLTKPFLVGLPNRHNALFDLSEGRLAAWWTGDTARQRTQGKTWYWELPLVAPQRTPQRPDIVLRRHGKIVEPQRHGQFVTEPDEWTRHANGVTLKHRLHFPAESVSDVADSNALATISIEQHLTTLPRGWRRTVRAVGLQAGETLAIRAWLASAQSEKQYETMVEATGDALWVANANSGSATLQIDYTTDEAVEPTDPVTEVFSRSQSAELDVMPGFRVTRLPLRDDVMPVALTWNPKGQLIVGSLKGRVWRATDSDGDQLEDELQAISDDLAAPYGLHAGEGFVDVVTKYGVVRLHDQDGDGTTDRHQQVATGWGHTADYHDWTVGLPRDAKGNYYVAIPCQQDDRLAAAAHLRGKVLRLKPRQPTHNNPRLFELEIVSAGHRFPMGIARNRDGQLVVTDNQGNYNPFNELNHVVDGAHFGFINQIERNTNFTPQLTPPAIDIPHPWTRSVNGICFLESPRGASYDAALYGPFAGHVLGCEYDTRRLVRMSLQAVDGALQGAIYPFAEAPKPSAEGLQGPIACGIAPDGAIYIANIRDSGWGGSNNVGSIARIVPDPDQLPAGIAEVTIGEHGFEIQMTRPVNRDLAMQSANYAVESYRRISTPVYGGDDVERRSELVQHVSVSKDARTVRLQFRRPLRAGFVYEFRLKNLASTGTELYPAEAFYTLRRLPKP